VVAPPIHKADGAASLDVLSGRARRRRVPAPFPAWGGAAR
jgi:hypothetical protein